MTQEMRLLSVEQLRFVSDTAYEAGVRASQDELRRLQSVETQSKERILRLEGALVKEVAINAQLLELMREIGNANAAQVAPVYSELARAAIAAAKGGA
jgi:phosphopantetheine adenylyltransferase